MTNYDEEDVMLPPPDVIYKGLRFHNTCMACPEQYDVFLEDRNVGYVRLRHAGLRVNCPDFMSDDVVYRYSWDEPYKGQFQDDAEREYHLKRAADAINQWLEEEAQNQKDNWE
jgi:hypothetical protein